MDLIKFSIAAVCFILAYVFYHIDLKNKKPLRPGDNRFFIENPNRISSYEYYASWKSVVWFIVAGIALLFWAFE